MGIGRCHPVSPRRRAAQSCGKDAKPEVTKLRALRAVLINGLNLYVNCTVVVIGWDRR